MCLSPRIIEFSRSLRCVVVFFRPGKIHSSEFPDRREPDMAAFGTSRHKRGRLKTHSRSFVVRFSPTRF